MLRPLAVAACQPECRGGDLAANVRAHADAVRSARARVVVFPELSLTGYDLRAECVPARSAFLRPLADACADVRAVALAGAPVRDRSGRSYIATLLLGAGRARVVYRKAWLAAAETERFNPGAGPAVVVVDGWRLGLGICKDTGVAEHVAETARLGVDAYAAGVVHRPEELPVQEERAASIARLCGAFVVLASFAGPTGGGFDRTAGTSSVWSPGGTAMGRAGQAAGDLVRAVIG